MSAVAIPLALALAVPANFDLADIEPVASPAVHEAGHVDIGPAQYGAISTRQNEAIEQRRVVFHVLNAADLATTIYCLEVADDCREANPIYGQRTELVVLGKVGSALIYEAVLTHLRKSGDLEAVRIFQWSNIVLMGGVVTWNVSVLF
jgi:hypothetical protein